MSRPLLPLALAFAVAASTLAGCKTSTPYTAMYSPRKSFYVPPPERNGKSAAELLGAVDAASQPATGGAIPGAIPGAPPAMPSGLAPAPAIPGLAPDPAAPAPAAPAPAAPAAGAPPAF